MVAVVINLNLEKSTLVFPILSNGTVTIIKDGYLRTYADGSGGYSEDNVEKFKCARCGEITYKRILKN